MADLRAAAQQALEALCLWSAGHELDAVSLNNLIDRLESMLAQQAELAAAELRAATEAMDDPAVNNLRTLPEAIRMLRAERDALRADADAAIKALEGWKDE